MKCIVFATQFALVGSCLSPLLAFGQNDGDHPFTDFNGETFLRPDLQVGLGVTPQCFTVGTAGSMPMPYATLRVRGDDLPVLDEMTPTWVCSFRTDATDFVDQNWSMHRGGIEVGRLFTHALGDENFHVQASSGDLRFWTREGSFFNTPPDPALDRARLKAKGSIVIGSVTNPQPIDGHFGIGPFSGVVSNPYTMLHVDQAGANDQGYREEMREGMSSSRGDDYG